jgi:uncharacterized cysteine cluster protein YcgN (CxxCxxCC family)
MVARPAEKGNFWMEKRFWEEKTLEEMDRAEWESLCDGCGRCCIFKMRDEDTGELFQTNVVCKLIDRNSGRCMEYESRSVLVPTCLTLDAALVRSIDFLPETCAYRLLSEGKKLPWWHPLVSGNPGTVRSAGIFVVQNAIPEIEADMDNLDDYIID